LLADNGTAFFISGTQDTRWGEYFDAITGITDEGLGFKNFAGGAFTQNVEFLDYPESAVVTQV
jgi:hypothetical protein